MEPLVTVGVPTHNRPELLRRTLAALAKQDHSNIEVVVADNATSGDSAGRVVQSFVGVIPDLRYVRHEVNIGAVENFLYLLSVARGRYFMWLADDDEISPNYIASLVKVLQSEPDASSAAGHWVLMQDEHLGREMPTSRFEHRSQVVRALRFIWRTDDAFFYALHRTDVLRQASFRGYWWPNRDSVWNWAYVYLLDVVLKGRVLVARDPSVQFINHDYTPKAGVIASRTLLAVATGACRRVNVHLLYWEKCARELNVLWMPLVVATSIVSLAREGSMKVLHRMIRMTGRESAA
jgi:glycosyltransferase involved in cell wall biosynthesis